MNDRDFCSKIFPLRISKSCEKNHVFVWSTNRKIQIQIGILEAVSSILHPARFKEKFLQSDVKFLKVQRNGYGLMGNLHILRIRDPPKSFQKPKNVHEVFTAQQRQFGRLAEIFEIRSEVHKTDREERRVVRSWRWSEGGWRCRFFDFWGRWQ